MISRALSPPVPSAGRSGEIPMLSIPASIRVSVADHTPFDRRVYVTLPYSWPHGGPRGGVHREEDVISRARIHLKASPFVVRELEVRSVDVDFRPGGVNLDDPVSARPGDVVGDDDHGPDGVPSEIGRVGEAARCVRLVGQILGSPRQSDSIV